MERCDYFGVADFWWGIVNQPFHSIIIDGGTTESWINTKGLFFESSAVNYATILNNSVVKLPQYEARYSNLFRFITGTDVTDTSIETTADWVPTDEVPDTVSLRLENLLSNVTESKFTSGWTNTNTGTIGAAEDNTELGYSLNSYTLDGSAQLGRRLTTGLSPGSAGTHSGSDNAAVLTDSTKTWSIDSLVGYTITNSTDGSSSTITANTATTVTGILSGGTDNDWDLSDSYIIAIPGTYTFSAWVITQQRTVVTFKNGDAYLKTQELKSGFNRIYCIYYYDGTNTIAPEFAVLGGDGAIESIGMPMLTKGSVVSDWNASGISTGFVPRIFYADSIPTSGRFSAGDIVFNNAPSIDGNNMVLSGWKRITTSANHVSNTDWALMYTSTVSPAN